MRRSLAEAARRLAFQHSLRPRPCAHLAAVGDRTPERAACRSCEAVDGTWVKLRMCLTCGEVGCCDSTPGQHARAHFDATGHPVIRSIEPGESWRWCYPDQAYLGEAGERA